MRSRGTTSGGYGAYSLGTVRQARRCWILNKKKHSGKLAPSQLDRLERELATTDAEIDNLVYALYGITDEERTIVENM